MKKYLLIADKYSNLCYWQTVINVASNCELQSMLVEDFQKNSCNLKGCEVAFIFGNEAHEDLNELQSVFEYLEKHQIPMYLNVAAHQLYEQLNMPSNLKMGLLYFEMSILDFAKMLEQSPINRNGSYV